MAKYLYNGIELPALPEWDKEAYPYAFIMGDSQVSNVRYVQSISWVTSDSTGNPAVEYGEFISYKYDNYTGLWGDSVWSSGRKGSAYCSMVLWANFDVIDARDGSVYLAASDPVPVPDEPETVLSWQKHDAYKPNTKWDGNTFYRGMGGKWEKQDAMNPSVVVEDEPTGDPIAYLYNDVQLPDINRVWTDKVTYPYAMITRTITNGSYLLLVCGDMPYYTEQAYNAEEGYHPVVISPGPYKGFAYVAGSWVLSIENTDSGVSNNAGNLELIWTNVDVMNKDNGSVYFDASEPPVPVYA